MSKEHKRSNREVKKPKQPRAVPAAAPPFAKGTPVLVSQDTKKKT